MRFVTPGKLILFNLDESTRGGVIERKRADQKRSQLQGIGAREAGSILDYNS
jgi:hypothetical protein